MASIGAAAEAALQGVSPPGHGTKVYKSECAFSFVTPEDEEGLYVNLRTFVGVSKEFLDSDCAAAGFPGGVGAYLHVRWTKITPAKGEKDGEESKKLTKVAIGVPGGAPTESVSFDRHHALVLHPSGERLELPAELPSADLPSSVNAIIERVLESDDASKQEEVKAAAWEQKIEVSGFAASLAVVDSPPKISPDPKQWKCFRCDLRENLWLNLSTGVIGCGRRQYDGSGGNSHAYDHFNETGKAYPLCVKLGTITPDGADVYSYHPDENDMVEDPQLAEHLARFGIDVMKMRKTDKTMGELQLDLNNRAEFNTLTEGGSVLLPATGPGLVGLRNLGNSCYINSCLQALATMPEFRNRYLAHAPAILRSLPATQAVTDITVQLAKIAVALGTDRYVKDVGVSADATPAATSASSSSSSSSSSAAAGAAASATMPYPEDPGPDADPAAREAYRKEMERRASLTAVAPRMFRALAGAGHPEFSTTRQQDAAEYLAHLLDLVDRAERRERSRGGPGADVFAATGGKLSSLFELEEETRLECLTSHTVRYKTAKNTAIVLPIPTDKATNAEEVKAAEAKASSESEARQAQTDTAAAEEKEEADADQGTSSGEDDGHEAPAKSARTGESTDAATASAAAASAAAAAAAAAPSSSSSSTGDGTEVPLLEVPFEECLQEWSAASLIPDLRSDATGQPGPHSKTTRFSRFPPYLLLQMRRYTVGDDWQPVKITARVPVPETLDLRTLRAKGGLQPGETAMPEPSEGGGASSSEASAPTPDAGIVAQLMEFGMASENACKRAALAVGNSDAGAAGAWLMEHLTDADINDPIESEAGAAGGGDGDAPPAEAVAMMVSMGVLESHAVVALSECDNDVARAAEWVFSRDPSEIESMAAARAAAASASAASSSSAAAALEVTEDWAARDGEGVYDLFAIISHLGKNTGGGHYVAHCKKNGVWCIFNDRKVAVSKTPPLSLGYMYLFRRRDAPGSIDDEPGRPHAHGGAAHPVNQGASASSSSSSSSSSTQ